MRKGIFSVKADWVSKATRVDKPWGYEEWFAMADGFYAGKCLHIRAGNSLSLQFHKHKDETVHVFSGELTMIVGPHLDALETFDLQPGESVRLRPGVLHRMTARRDCVVLEASTTQLGDVIRLDDDYGRQLPGAPEEIRLPGDRAPRA